MNLVSFNYIIPVATVFWVVGITLFIPPLKQKLKIIGLISILIGQMLLIFNLSLFWININQPAIRSVNETFIWYPILITFLGYFVLFIWKNKWFFIVSLLLSLAFLIHLIFNRLAPVTYYNTLFQSNWFIPHVAVYLFAYVILTGAFIFNVAAIYQSFRSTEVPVFLKHTNILVNFGFVLITAGLTLGIFWAKDARGQYWMWDTKENWALLTWILYLVYIHLRYYQPLKYKINLWILIIAYFTLLFCWLGISFLAANANSIHNFVR